MTEVSEFLVGINCITYNQHAFIVDAMNGFTMQQTNFPFVTVIVDDASSDGEPGVIQKYIGEHFDLSSESETRQWENEEARYVYARHKDNKNCYFAVVFLKTNYYSKKKSKSVHTNQWLNDVKYIAICEGDDCWTDAHKLQLQVDFMETHPDYSMCFHNAIEHWENGEKSDRLFSNIQDRDYNDIEIYENWIVPTASVLYKSSILYSDLYVSAKSNRNFIYGDIILFLSCARHGKVRGLSRCMSIYRRHAGGMVFSMDTAHLINRSKHHYAIHKVFGDKFKKLSIERYSNDALLSVSRLRAEGNSFIPVLFDVFLKQPVKTIKYIFKVPLKMISNHGADKH